MLRQNIDPMPPSDVEEIRRNAEEKRIPIKRRKVDERRKTTKVVEEKSWP